MKIGLVVPNDIDYGLDIAHSLCDAGVSVTLYFSYSRMALYLLGRNNQDKTTGDEMEHLLRQRGLLPTSCCARFFLYPKIRNPRSFNVIHKIRQTLHVDSIDVAHLLIGPGDLWSSVLAHIIRDIPVVSTMIIPKPNYGEKLSKIILKAINGLHAVGSDVLIVNGESQVSYVHKTYRVPRNHIAYMPLGPRVSAAKWATASDVEENGTVLFFGRSHPHKGLEYLIQAQPMVSSRVPNARFLIVAHGDNLERYRHMIIDKSKIEIFDGFRPSAEAMAFFRKASLVVLPYISASTSGVLMTAYVFSKPVVATMVGCLPEYVLHGETGLLVPPKDPSELANAISLLLLDDDLRRRMGENAKRFAEEKQKNIGTQLISIYNKAIELKRDRRVRKER